MTAAEVILRLQRDDLQTELYVCHFARRAGKNIPIIRPLAEIRWLQGRVCLVEADDRNLYLADR